MIAAFKRSIREQGAGLWLLGVAMRAASLFALAALASFAAWSVYMTSAPLFLPDAKIIRSEWSILWGEYALRVFLNGTVVTSVNAVLMAVPLGLVSAVFLREVVPERLAKHLRALVQMAARMPGVIYGVFGVVAVVPFLHLTSGLWSSGAAASITLAFMILPTFIALADAAMATIPKSVRDSSRSLGATRAQTLAFVVLPSCYRELGGAALVAWLRATGEAVAVLLVCGNMPVAWPHWSDYWQHGVSTLAANIAQTMTTAGERASFTKMLLIGLTLTAGSVLIRVCLDWLITKAGEDE